MTRGVNVIPDRYFARLKYNQIIPQSTAAIENRYVFRGNSIYDPDLTGTGAQPVGTAELMALYHSYRVHGSKIKIEVIQIGDVSDSTTIHTVKYSLRPTLDSSDVSTSVDAANPYAKSFITDRYERSIATNYMSTKKIFGYPSISQQAAFSGTISTNPGTDNSWYWVIDYIEANGTVPPGTGNISVTITYYVEFNRRLLLDA